MKALYPYGKTYNKCMTAAMIFPVFQMLFILCLSSTKVKEFSLYISTGHTADA